MGRKPSDWWAIPLCSVHHDYQHNIGEPAFEAKYKIDMKAIARDLFARWQRETAQGRKYAAEQREKEAI